MKDLLSTSSFIRQILARYGDSQPLGTRGTPVNGRTTPSVFGPERRVSSENLDVEGRADLIYKDSSSAIHVVDYKSGKVTDENGQPKREFLLQVATYGIAVSERFPPPHKIILELLSPNSEWTGQLNEELAFEVKTLLEQVNSLLPKNTSVDTNRLATIGSHCHSCSYRPTCPAYTLALEDEKIDQTCQCDLSGTIFEVSQQADMAIIRLRTKGGRIAAITGVPRDIYPELHVGARIHAYSLGITDVLSRARYPANFYMYRPENPRESAFSAMILALDASPT
jgi:CRISPR/Cas system-associated exonuclease Cas4 (RecB family)